MAANFLLESLKIVLKMCVVMRKFESFENRGSKRTCMHVNIDLLLRVAASTRVVEGDENGV